MTQDDIKSSFGEWFVNYKNGGFRIVEGWLEPKFLDTLRHLHRIQTDLGVVGGALEIGVHHGRFFLPLNAMVDEQKHQSFAIDLFSQQELNIDHSGHGNLERFQENLKAFDRFEGGNVHVIAADSTRLDPASLGISAETRPKLISIDGGHTVEHTIHDLEIAETLIHERGLVFLDDMINRNWLGVLEGLITYLQQRPTLWPVFLGYNKMILAPMSAHHLYKEEIQKIFEGSKTSEFVNYEFIIV